MAPSKMTTSLPRVSVIIPVRNGKDYLQEALDSVLQQSYSDLELILIDDGSTDDDYDRYALHDPRVRVIHLPGLGVSNARNYGMEEARGEFIAFLDADDVWYPGKLLAQINYFDLHPEIGVVFGHFTRWEVLPTGKFPPASILMQEVDPVSCSDSQRSGWLYTRLLLGLLVGMNTAVIRREVYSSIGGFNPSMRQGEDYDFWLKASRIAEMHSLACNVALYRIHSASAMHKLSNENHLVILLKAAATRWGLSTLDGHSLTTKQFNSRLSQISFAHGYAHYWHGSPRVARQSFYQSMVYGGLKIRSLIYIFSSYFLIFFKNYRA